MAAGSCCKGHVSLLYYGLWLKARSLVIVRNKEKTVKYLYYLLEPSLLFHFYPLRSSQFFMSRVTRIESHSSHVMCAL